MDFDQLETFVEVARHASFSRAAEKRFRTQPAISSQIRALEDEIGAKLFDRSGGKVSLTAPGKSFLQYAEESLERKRVALASVAEMERVPRGEIVVAANEATCLHVLPEVFAEFKRQYPKVAVSILRAEHAKIMDAIIDNTADFGIVSMPVSDTRLTVVPVHRDELVLIAPPRHPLARMDAAAIADIAKFPLLVPKVGRTRDAIEQIFDEQRVRMNISMELDSSELLKRFVAADVGVGFIGKSTVQAEVKAGLLAAVPIAGVHIRRDLGLVFRKDKALSRAALAFIDTTVRLKQVAPPPAASSAQ